jgi:serine/threonine protein kinase
MGLGEHERIVGRVIDDKYRIVKLIGRGGMGAVYLAGHEGTGRLVALKVITPELMTDELVVERFKREAFATGQLRHPNVVNVTDFGFASADGERLAYLVMEHLVGQTLAELLEAEGRLPLALVVDILQQTCAAVQEAHRCDIIHRDLKPENIWLEARLPDGYHVKVLDFGIAKLRSGPLPECAPEPFEVPADLEVFMPTHSVDPAASTLVVPTPPSSSGMSTPQAGGITQDALLGTPLYMPPEQWLNRAVDARSDVYSLGVIAYRMLAGEVPFTGRTATLYMEHIRSPAPPLSERTTALPSAVASLVMGALEKDATRRPPTAKAFATTLAAAAETSGELMRRAVSLSVEHFPAIIRVAIIAYGPILTLAALRIVNRRLVAAGVLSLAVGRAVGTATIVAHAICVIFLIPTSVGLVTPLVRDLVTAPHGPPRPAPSTAEVFRCLRSSFVPTSLITIVALGIIVGVRVPLEWLSERAGLFSESSSDQVGVDAIISMAIEVVTLVVLVRVMRGFAVYSSVVAMERRGGIGALRRSADLTRSCRTGSGHTLLFHFLPRTFIGPWFLLAFAQLARIPYREVISTSSDTLTGANALTGLYLIHMLVAPFGMVALSLLYLKTRRLEGASLDSIVPAPP